MLKTTKQIVLFVAILGLVNSVWAQTINMTGTIVDSLSSQAINGALVKIIEYPEMITSSVLNGTFSLNKGTTITSPMRISNNSADIVLLGNRLTVNDQNVSGLISVDVYNCQGMRIYHSQKKSGSYTFDKLWNVPGMYYIKVQSGNSTVQFTSLGLASKSISVTPMGASYSASTTATYKLVISAVGYSTKEIALSNLVSALGSIKMKKTTLPSIGNPTGTFTVPAEAMAVNTSTPDRVVGNGTPESCTGQAFVSAVALGGIITFNCGPNPITIVLDKTAKVFNDAKPDVVIDGGGKVTLSGGGKTRILYMNTCDQNQHWTTSHCDNQDSPRLTVQNLTFVNGNSKNETEYDGGGAIWVRGGRFKINSCSFYNNECGTTGPDLGGGGVRVFSQYNKLPVYVVKSTFGGADGYGNVGSNGGGISSIDVNWTIINSLFSYNSAIGNGGNPAASGTPGGGSGGAIYNDGNTMTLTICGTKLEYNEVNAYGSGVFFVSNNHMGTIHVENSVIQNNYGGSWYPLPNISMHDDTKREIISSTIGP